MMFLEICKNRGIQARVFPLTFKVDPIMNLMSESYYKYETIRRESNIFHVP